jgi:hypothetical protein
VSGRSVVIRVRGNRNRGATDEPSLNRRGSVTIRA